MANTYTVLLSELVSEFNLDFFYKSTDFDKIRVTVDDISRPGLHLAGFFDHYEPLVCRMAETCLFPGTVISYINYSPDTNGQEVRAWIIWNAGRTRS